MSEIKNLTCIECPMGCDITVILEQNSVLEITGNRCPRGKAYAQNEVVCPKRVITTTVRLKNGGMLSVKTSAPVEKTKVFEIIKRINAVVVETPVRIGDIIIANIENGVDLLATDNKD
jgi:CxxC motif-containing protein